MQSKVLKPSIITALEDLGVTVEEQGNILQSYIVQWSGAKARYDATVANMANLERQRDEASADLQRIEATILKLTDHDVRLTTIEQS